MDLFARSAFNRYYYACFYEARYLMRLHYPGAKVPAHKDIPDSIEKIIRMLLRQVRNAHKTGLINWQDRVKKEGARKALGSSWSVRSETDTPHALSPTTSWRFL